MHKKLLHETGTVDVKRVGSKWRAVLITPGQGSSGFYSESVLQESCEAFVPGTKNYFMHPNKPTDQRDPRDQWGFIPENVQYEPGVGITAEIQVLPHWKEVVDSLAESGQANLSIWAMGETDEDGNVVTLLPDAQNTVDLVAFPGRPGSALTEKMYESARAASDKPGATSAQETQEEGNMDKVLEALALLTTKLDTFITESKTAAAGAVKAEADADAIEKAKEDAVADAVKKVTESFTAIDAVEGLLPSQVKSLREAAERGEDVTPLIEQAKTVITEAAKVLGEARTGYVATTRTSESAAAGDIKFSGFGG